MAPRVVCPLGESRGPVVYCRVVKRPVNPLAFPCTTARYVSCRFYRQAQAEEAAASAETSLTRTPSAGTPPIPASGRPATEERREQAVEAETHEYDIEEAEKLLDPLFQAGLVLDYTPLTFTASGATLEEVAKDLYSEVEKAVGEGCFVAKR
ncbi:hypothetical protein [Aeropyrum camini]|uniref:hypothetical protein n=1 Tax=Aeropyrum camini TaxID=229980 RepID=UPI0012E29C5B|nr:hypothetical protein [Aeropyrum camini]